MSSFSLKILLRSIHLCTCMVKMTFQLIKCNSSYFSSHLFQFSILSNNDHFLHDYCGLSGALVESIPFDRRVAGSNPAL